jgi:LysR family transcriptional regulator, glycine cleavage system transcriptional activator
MASLPPLSAIRCFEAAARHGSFTRAAAELGMTQAAVSYQIKLLEDRLGHPLFLRGARGVSLSEAGRSLAPAVTEAFEQLRAAFDALTESAGGVLAISAVSSFATNWLVPRLGEFQLAHPGLAVRLDTSPRYVDFAREEIDVAIRAGRGPWPGLAQHHLMGIAYTPLLSPQLLERFGPLSAPADLLKLPLIDPTDVWWPDWFAAAGVPAPDLSQSPDLRGLTQQLAGNLALAGHGAAILTPAFFADELVSGRLVQPLPFVRSSEDSYWLVYPEIRRRSAKIRAFRDWLLAAVQADGARIQA